MKRTWAATLEVFKAIDKVCVDNGITYFVDWGTMLGAVRHGGFVPWDDDFDICMKRSDYMRFLEVAPGELPEDFCLLNVYNDHDYEELLTRVVNRREISFGMKYMREFHGFPYNAGVDLFPLDYVHDDAESEKTRCNLAMMLNGILLQYGPDDMTITVGKEEIKELSEGLRFPIYEGRPVRQQLYQMLDHIFSIYGPNDGKRIATVAMTISYNNKALSEEMYEDIIRIPFGGTEVPVPILYDRMLELKYGDYMKCIRDWNTHNYPIYRGLEEEVHNQGAAHVWPDYLIEDVQEQIDGQLDRLKDERAEPADCEGIREVVFLPYMAADWKWIEPLWVSMQDDPKIKTYVIPIPYYDKDDCGELADFHYEGAFFPEYVPITEFDKYDLENKHPSKIIIQNPYDNMDTAFSVPPFFYSERIAGFTDELCYIPPFILDEFGTNDLRVRQTMDFFCTCPGVVFSDSVYVQSENMRNRYIEKLISFAGENTHVLWEHKLHVIDWILPESESQGIAEEDIPQDWWSVLLDSDGNGKKVVLYYNSISRLAQYKQAYIDKAIRVLKLFEEYSEKMTVLWCPDKMIFEEVPSKYKKWVDKYCDLLNEYKDKTYVILETEYDVEKTVAISDAYYGDKGYIMHRFERTGRPVMIQNVEIV